MFKTCIYCHRSLGANESVENFPVGRRLAFDSERGRLWVICDGCRRWNLSPLEERWEAIEECERQYRDTPSSFSTDQIGLAQLHEGLELVRVGRPQRREFAAWRYGKQFLARRIRSMVRTAAEVVISGAGLVVGADIFWIFIFNRKKRIVAQVHSEEGERMRLIGDDVKKAKLVRSDSPEGWALQFRYRHRNKRRPEWWPYAGNKSKEAARLSGAAAIRAAGKILPRVNDYGGTNSQVRDAVLLIDEAGSAESLYAMRSAQDDKLREGRLFDTEASVIKKMDAEVRLALEMAAHEESERRALEGELATLEREWRAAEEVASIADRLLVPDRIEEWIRDQKKRFASSVRSREQ